MTTTPVDDPNGLWRKRKWTPSLHFVYNTLATADARRAFHTFSYYESAGWPAGSAPQRPLFPSAHNPSRGLGGHSQ